MCRGASLASMLLLAACTTKPQTTAGLSEQMPLHPARNDLFGGTLVYRARDVNLRSYHAIYIPPATVYDGTDADWGGTSVQTRQRVADALTADFRQALQATASTLPRRPGRTSLRCS
jgi:hypothetical protein